MTVLQLTLSDRTSERLDALARQTGQTPDALAHAAVEQLVGGAEASPTTAALADDVPTAGRVANGTVVTPAESAATSADGTAPAGEPAWKAAWRQAAGMWKDRDDIPGLMAELRQEWNRVEPPDGPLE